MIRSVDNVNRSALTDSESVMEAIHSVMHLFRAQQYRVLKDGPHDLTHMEGKVLAYFLRHPGASQKDLVTHSARDKGQVAKLIAGLKQQGLLEGKPDQADRRNVRLFATAAGIAVHEALARESRLLSDLSVAGIPREQQRLLLELLNTIQANLESAR